MENGEEFISNKFNERFRSLQAEKERLVRTVEREEEFLTITLQKKLKDILQSKINMENSLEQEQEFIVNLMTKKLAAAMSDKLELERKLEAEKRSKEQLMRSFDSELSFDSSSDSDLDGDDNKVRMRCMAHEVKHLRNQLKLTQAEVVKFRKLTERLDNEAKRITWENFELGKKLAVEERMRSESEHSESSDSLSLNSSLEFSTPRSRRNR